MNPRLRYPALMLVMSCFSPQRHKDTKKLEMVIERPALRSTKKQSITMSLRGVFCRSNPLNTSEEIASSQNPLLAMTESLFLAQ